MRKSITIQPKWSRCEEYVLMCTVSGIGLNVLIISKRAIYKRGLNSNDMKSAGFFEDKKQFVKYI